MSVLVVLLVAVAAYLYVRTSRQARIAWLHKLDLPGRWYGERSAADGQVTELTLNGQADSGEFVRKSGDTIWKGSWRLHGHTLTLTGAGGNGEETFELHYFKPGSIGLEESSGKRQVLTKSSDNIVSLHSHRKADIQS